MANITGNGSKGHHKFTLEVNQTSQSVANNTSIVSYTFKISPIDTSWAWEQWGANITYKITINGTAYSGSIANYDGYSTVTLKSGTQTVTHNADGSKSIPISFSVTDTSGQSYTCGNASASGTVDLTKIARYGTSLQSLKSKTETTITMNWSSDNTVDYLWYSTDWGTTWKGVDVADGKSGSYTISQPSGSSDNLAPNTTYNIVTRIRRKDSQLTTNSSKLSVTTYDFPYCNSMPNFTIGNAVTIGFYNPLGRNIYWQVLGNDNSIIAGSPTTGTSYLGISGDGSVNNLYASIPNAKSGTYKVKVTYESSEITKTGGTYSINASKCTPTMGTVTYADTNTTVTAITGNNQHIVQNKSNLKVTYTQATAKYSATITKYTIVLNNVTKTSTTTGTVDFGTINSANNLTVTVTATDSRGLTAKATKTITMLAHSNPNAIVTLKRLNNYEDETYLTVDGSISSVNSKNNMTIQYRYKVSGGSYNSFANISDNTKITLSLSKANSYIFNIVVTDSFGATYNKEYVLNKGVFPLFIDTSKNSIGVNCFPSSANNLFVNNAIVVESGSGWVRYYDGTQICYGQIQVTPNFQAWGVLYSTDDSTVRNFPKAFISAPRVELTNTGTTACFIIRALANASAIVGVSLARPNIPDASSYTFQIDYVAIGKWK